MAVSLERYRELLKAVSPFQISGRVRQVIGLVIESDGPPVSVGELCLLYRSENHAPGETAEPLPCEVVGFRGKSVLLMPLGEMEGITPGSLVAATGHGLSVRVGPSLLGRVLDGLGNPMDEKGALSYEKELSISRPAPPPLSRTRITSPLPMGVRAIDSCLTIGKGQRMGIFSGSGIGKSTLLGMIARNTRADVSVISLIGERGREVKDFLERDLGEEGLSRSVVVVATSDSPALIRVKAALVATTIAEYFREEGLDVNLMMDSVTRFAVAQREIGLAIGEPPTTKGYTPSVFALLPKLLERAGTSSTGSITGLYTILVEADDMNEPIADAIRAILDGHIVLSRDLASRNHYPPIDVLPSISRVMIDIVSESQRNAANKLREILATYAKAEDLIRIGAYVAGSDQKVDYAISMIDRINAFLIQGIGELASYEETVYSLEKFFS